MFLLWICFERLEIEVGDTEFHILATLVPILDCEREDVVERIDEDELRFVPMRADAVSNQNLDEWTI